MELRELRDYIPGDPLKTMAWRATARLQRPMVRSFEEERIERLQILLEISPEMRAGPLGESPLDQAMDQINTLMEQAKGARLGLSCFDYRVYSHLPPGRGRAHLRRMTGHLLGLNAVVDEDLTEISEGALTARLGAFLEAQDGLSCRNHQAWSFAEGLADPLGELYDLGLIYEAALRFLRSERGRALEALYSKARPAKDLLYARLRLFAALRGVSLPYRLSPAPKARVQGLKAAISRNLRPGGAERFLLLSTLPDLEIQGVLRFARSRGKRIIRLPLLREKSDDAVR